MIFQCKYMGLSNIFENFMKFSKNLEKSEKQWYFQIFHFLRFFLIPQKWKIFWTRARILKQIGYSKRSRWDLSEYMVIFKIRARLENIFHFWVPRKKSRKTEKLRFLDFFRFSGKFINFRKIACIFMYFHWKCWKNRKNHGILWKNPGSRQIYQVRSVFGRSSTRSLRITKL